MSNIFFTFTVKTIFIISTKYVFIVLITAFRILQLNMIFILKVQKTIKESCSYKLLFRIAFKSTNQIRLESLKSLMASLSNFIVYISKQDIWSWPLLNCGFFTIKNFFSMLQLRKITKVSTLVPNLIYMEVQSSFQVKRLWLVSCIQETQHNCNLQLRRPHNTIKLYISALW